MSTSHEMFKYCFTFFVKLDRSKELQEAVKQVEMMSCVISLHAESKFWLCFINYDPPPSSCAYAVLGCRGPGCLSVDCERNPGRTHTGRTCKLHTGRRSWTQDPVAVVPPPSSPSRHPSFCRLGLLSPSNHTCNASPRRQRLFCDYRKLDLKWNFTLAQRWIIFIWAESASAVSCTSQ